MGLLAATARWLIFSTWLLIMAVFYLPLSRLVGSLVIGVIMMGATTVLFFLFRWAMGGPPQRAVLPEKHSIATGDTDTPEPAAEAVPLLPVSNTSHATQSFIDVTDSSPQSVTESIHKGRGSNEPDEEMWTKALIEFEGPSRRTGLWAKAFSEAQGNDSAAKAFYLRYRATELAQERHLTDERDAEIAHSNLKGQKTGTLTPDEIAYLGSPIKAVRYLKKYQISEDKLAKACAMGKISSVTSDGVLWVSDSEIAESEGALFIQNFSLSMLAIFLVAVVFIVVLNAMTS